MEGAGNGGGADVNGGGADGNGGGADGNGGVAGDGNGGYMCLDCHVLFDDITVLNEHNDEHHQVEILDPVPPLADPALADPVPPLADPAPADPVPPLADPAPADPVPPLADPVPPVADPVPPVADPAPADPVPPLGDPAPAGNQDPPPAGNQNQVPAPVKQKLDLTMLPGRVLAMMGHFTCTHCVPKKIVGLDAMRQHNSAVHGGWKHCCSMCMNVFKKKRTVESHERVGCWPEELEDIIQ